MVFRHQYYVFKWGEIIRTQNVCFTWQQLNCSYLSVIVLYQCYYIHTLSHIYVFKVSTEILPYSSPYSSHSS